MRIRMTACSDITTEERTVSCTVGIKYHGSKDYVLVGQFEGHYYAEIFAAALRKKKSYSGKRPEYKDVKVLNVIKAEVTQ